MKKKTEGASDWYHGDQLLQIVNKRSGPLELSGFSGTTFNFGRRSVGCSDIATTETSATF